MPATINATPVVPSHNVPGKPRLCFAVSVIPRLLSDGVASLTKTFPHRKHDTVALVRGMSVRQATSSHNIRIREATKR